MRYGIDVTNFGSYADPRPMSRLARAVEEAGWDGLFVWDHLAFVEGIDCGDPWVLLTAAGMVTERIRLGTSVTPLPRRRPQVVAHAVATLDTATSGRMVLGVGLGGVEREFTAFGESGDAKDRAEKLDEALEVVSGLWSGEEVTYRGSHYTVDGVTLGALPVQRPRPPIWVGGESRPALRRAARWDGWVISGVAEPPSTGMRLTPDDIASSVEEIRRHRTSEQPAEIVVAGYSEPGDASLVRAYEQAGATWWLESIHDLRGSAEEMLERVSAGPPEG